MSKKIAIFEKILFQEIVLRGQHCHQTKGERKETEITTRHLVNNINFDKKELWFKLNFNTMLRFSATSTSQTIFLTSWTSHSPDHFSIF